MFKINTFFLILNSSVLREAYTYNNFELKKDCIAYVFRDKIEEEQSQIICEDFFKQSVQGILSENKLENVLSFLPRRLDDFIRSLMVKNDKFYLLYSDFKEEKNIFNLDADEILNKKSLDCLIKEYDYESDIGFFLSGDNVKWSYFYGENLYEGILEPDTWESFHLLIVKKNFERVFLSKLKNTFKNVTITKFLDDNVVTNCNDKVYLVEIE